MKIIVEYLDSLFLNVPVTPETKKAKEDLLALMEDHYNELIAEGKNEHEAIGAVITEFGSIDELLDELGVQREIPQATSEKKIAQEHEQPQNSLDDDFNFDEEDFSKAAWRANHENFDQQDWDTSDYAKEDYAKNYVEPITLDEAEDYWRMIRQFALFIASGVLLCVVAIASLILLANRGVEGIGLASFFLLVAVAVGMFITAGMKFTRTHKALDDRPIKEEVRATGKMYAQQYHRSFSLSLVAGIFLCIVSFMPIFIFQYAEYFGVALFLIIAGLGAFLIIYGSIVQTYYKRFDNGSIFISDEGEPGPNARQHLYGKNAPIVGMFSTIYWPVVVVIYFIWSFVFHGWGYSWLIFVIAGIFQDSILKYFKNKR